MQLLFIAATLLLAPVAAAAPGSEQPGRPQGQPHREGPIMNNPRPLDPDEEPRKPQGQPHREGPIMNNPRPLGPGEQPRKPQGQPHREGPIMNNPRPLGPGEQPGNSQGPPQDQGPPTNNPRPPRHSGKPQGPPKDNRPHMKNPGPLGNIVFSPAFKVDNVTLQNAVKVPLQQGENIFLMPKFGERGPPPHQGGKHGPPRNGQYVKLIYNATEPNKFSVEFGVFKPDESSSSKHFFTPS